MKKIRILLADDHAIVCAGLAKLLQPHYEVVGSVEDGRALLKAADELNPDVVVLDIGMPLLNGLDAARELKKRKPFIKLIFLTMETDSYIAAEAFRAGAAAYLLKTSRPSELLQAVHDAVRGVSYVTPQIGRAIENHVRPGSHGRGAKAAHRPPTGSPANACRGSLHERNRLCSGDCPPYSAVSQVPNYGGAGHHDKLRLGQVRHEARNDLGLSGPDSIVSYRRTVAGDSRQIPA